VTAALVAAVTVLAVSAHRRCRADLAALRNRVATTAAVADVFGQARARWDRGTAAMSTAMVAVFAVAPARGFGDVEVADELLKRALAAPILAELEEQLEWT
jgi:hypothetical protein